jgi:hypothetical protein
MLDLDPFDPERWETTAETVPLTLARKRTTQKRKPVGFLKGPIPWPWLAKAMTLPGKALAIGVMLWREFGCTGNLTVYFSLPRAVAVGIPKSTAHRAVETLEEAGLIKVTRLPGHGLSVEILDAPQG